MEFWTKAEDQLTWKQWPDVVQGLSRLRGAQHNSILLVTDQPNDEIESLYAAVTLARQLTNNRVTVIVASPYPSNEWLAPLQESGIDHVWVVERGVRSKAKEFPEPSQLEGIQNMCPALHVRTNQQVSLSVCGCHRDRMVLAQHHLKHWCLAHYEDCPHWPGEM